MSGHRLPSDLARGEWVPIPDPGSGLRIPTTIYGQCKLALGSGAETNTLADPERAGVWLGLTVYSTSGGSRVITAASKINTTGNTIMTFNAVDDTILLLSIPYASGAFKARWEVILADSVSLS